MHPTTPPRLFAGGPSAPSGHVEAHREAFQAGCFIPAPEFVCCQGGVLAERGPHQACVTRAPPSSLTRRDCYTMGQVVGEGGFGIVRLVTHNVTGEKLAVKIIKKARRAAFGAASRHESALVFAERPSRLTPPSTTRPCPDGLATGECRPERRAPLAPLQDQIEEGDATLRNEIDVLTKVERARPFICTGRAAGSACRCWGHARAGGADGPVVDKTDSSPPSQTRTAWGFSSGSTRTGKFSSLWSSSQAREEAQAAVVVMSPLCARNLLKIRRGAFGAIFIIRILKAMASAQTRSVTAFCLLPRCAGGVLLDRIVASGKYCEADARTAFSQLVHGASRKEPNHLVIGSSH